MSSIILPTGRIENIKMVIFDKDGTLIDVHHYWCSMIEFRANRLVKSIDTDKKEELYESLVEAMGIDFVSKKMKASGPVGIKPRGFIVEVALEVMQNYHASYTREAVEEIFKRVDEYSETVLKSIVKFLPEVKEVLTALNDEGILISIATTDLTKRASLAMSALEITEYFTDIVGADLVEQAKPSADLVEYLLAKHGLAKEEVIVVGDSMADLGMAQNASCAFVGVKTGLYNDAFIQKSHYLLETLKALKVEK
jgi:phosphoglycolate phosphatase